MKKNKQILSLLRNIYPVPLFNNEQEAEVLLNICEEIQLEENQRILEAGKEWPGLYFIMEGKVLVMNEISGRLVIYNQLYCYEQFGNLTENNLIDFSFYSAEPTTLLYIPKSAFQKFLATHPALEKAITIYKCQEIEPAIPSFQIQTANALPSKNFQASVESLKVKKLLPNEILIRQGDEAKEAYIVKHGYLTAHIDEEPNKVLATMMPGDIIGEIALLKHIKRTSNVIAKTEASVFILSKQEFFRLFNEQKQFKNWINSLVKKRIGSSYVGLRKNSFFKGLKRWLKDRLGYFPIVLEEQPKDTGASCLAMICRYYGKPVDIDCMRILVHANQLEMTYEATLANISQGAERIGLVPLTALASYEHLMDSALPVIVGWGLIRWAVVYKVTNSNVLMVDPAFGIQEMSRDTFMEEWNSFVIYFQPTERFLRNS